MKLKKLVLQNIGAFANRNEIDFVCDKPIILIGGMNGRGKTTILEAVLLALYGKRSGSLIGNYQKFESYLQKLSNKSGNDNECFVELEFQVNLDKKTWDYVVKRVWNRKAQHLKVTTKVWKDGNEDEALSDSWDMFIEEILPHAVAPFFFFDGEKISKLALADNEEQISSSMKSLLGVDLIERLIQDLHIIESNKAKEIQKTEFSVQLQEQELQISEGSNKMRELQEELKKLQFECGKLERNLEELEDQYTSAGGHYATQKQNIEAEYEKVKREYEEVETDLLGIAGGDLPMRMVRGLLEDIADRTKIEQEQNEVQVILDRIPELYMEYAGGEKNKEQIEEFLEYVQSKQSGNSLVYEFDNTERFHLQNITRTLGIDNARTRKLLQKKKQLEQRMEELENYLLVKVEDEVVQNLYTEIKEKTALKAVSDERVAQRKQELEEMAVKQENLQKGRTRILEKMVENLENEEEAKRIIKYVQQQINILNAYKLELQKMKVGMLSNKMTECFNTIIAKDGLVETVDINPETLEFSYYNKQNQRVDKRSLSAGENQLLVIAMLWALGICAKVTFPLIIDTPLARLDSMHRSSLINNYFPYAGEQVIILSTDMEITTLDYDMLKLYVGKEYTLCYHEGTMSSTIEEGYFGRRIDDSKTDQAFCAR